MVNNYLIVGSFGRLDEMHEMRACLEENFVERVYLLFC